MDRILFYAVIKYGDSIYQDEPTIIEVFPLFDQAADCIIELNKNEFPKYNLGGKNQIGKNFMGYYDCDILTEKIIKNMYTWEDLELIIRKKLYSNSSCLGIKHYFKINEISINVQDIVKEALVDFMQSKFS